MDSVTESLSQKRTRRRGALLERAILDAAWEEVAERGWAGFTINGVAMRTGTAKAVIYRRWRDRMELAQDMLLRAADIPNPAFVSSGTLRTDLIAFLEEMASFLRGPFGSVARGVVTDTDRPSQDSLFGGEVPVIAAVAEIIAQAVARNELPRVPSALTMNVGHAVVMAEFFQTGQLPSLADITELVDTVWLPVLRVGNGPP
jgi:AcrR family transcriptional regulator